jgi:hypothetical protein
MYKDDEPNPLEILEGNLSAKIDGIIQIRCNQFFKKSGVEYKLKFGQLETDLQDAFNGLQDQLNAKVVTFDTSISKLTD